MGLDLLFNGFATFFTIKYVSACFIGAFIGTLVGILPGVGPTATMTLMLPFTLSYGPTFGLIMLSGVLCGAMYGGSTTSILVNIPGETASVVTCIDGYQMAKKGRAGAALTLVAIGSFIAGTVGIIGLQIFSPLLANAALAFGPPEYFSLMVLCFILLSGLTGGSPLKASIMFAIGFWLSTIGICPIDGVSRFTFGSNALMLGIEFLPIAVGIFGITEVFDIALKPYVPSATGQVCLRDLYPSKEEMKRSVFPIGRGTLVGFLIGLLPGPSGPISTFISYAIEKRISKTPEKFGTGMIEGVVAPESANNGASVSAMIPLLTLGVPFSAPMAVLLAGLMMHNIQPGPLLFANAPEMFWTFIAALYIGNIVLLILNLPMVGVFARIATIRPQLLMPFVSVICLFGVYSVRNNFFDVWVMILAGIAGVFFRKFNYPIPPLVIGLVLGPITENSLRKTLMTFKGNLLYFFDKPIALVFLSLAFALLIFKLLSYFFRWRSNAKEIMDGGD
jgi:putative tricarboxylic transport membrane protein